MEPTTELLPILAVIDIKNLKNGNSKISFPPEKTQNIYSMFKNEGFAYVKLSGKAVLIQRSLNGMEQVSIERLRDSLEHYFKNADYSELPADVTYHQVMDAYYQHAFLRSNPKLKAYLAGSLSEEEQHELLLKTDYAYRKAFQLQTMLEQLEKTSFKLAEDKISTYHKNDRHLYYKHIGENEYIVFNDIDDPKIKLRMFDCWISKFRKESDIGKKQPLATSSVMIDFKWHRDYPLIASYLN